MSGILMINGPNLNLLGKREPEIYGYVTLEQVNLNLTKIASKHNLRLDCFQSNIEGDLINKIHTALDDYDFIIINPGGLTHTSVALRDALLAVDKPFIEVHLSNVYKRDSFRQKSFLSDIAIGVITGFGHMGYEFALFYAINFLKGH